MASVLLTELQKGEITFTLYERLLSINFDLDQQPETVRSVSE